MNDRLLLLAVFLEVLAKIVAVGGLLLLVWIALS